MEDQLKTRLTEGSTWIRGLYMLFFAIAFELAVLLFTATAIAQFIFKLVTGNAMDRLKFLGQSLATFMYEIVLFETFQTEERPFPFKPWPGGAPGTTVSRHSGPTSEDASPAS